MKRLAGRSKTKKTVITILNFSFVRFLEGSDRLSSPKLSVKSSSPLPSPSSPAASSRPSVHVIDVNNAMLSANDSRPQKSDNDDDNEEEDETKNLKQGQRQSPPPIPIDVSTTEIKLDDDTTKPKPKRRRKRTKQAQKQQEKQPLLSDDAKRRAQTLLEKLAQSIENRSKQSHSNHIHPHTSFLGIEHYKNDPVLQQRSSMSSPDPFTNKLPPKARRRSSALNKNLHPSESTTTTNET